MGLGKWVEYHCPKCGTYSHQPENVEVSCMGGRYGMSKSHKPVLMDQRNLGETQALARNQLVGRRKKATA